MLELMWLNITYVFFRMVISGPFIYFLKKHIPFIAAVLILSQLSFIYDAIFFYDYFDVSEIDWLYIIYTDIIRTVRILAAWSLIAWINNYFNWTLSVFIGSEITFIFDYFIFSFFI